MVSLRGSRTLAVKGVTHRGGWGKAHCWLVVAVIVAMSALVLWPARATLRSVQTVAVRPALPVAATVAPADASSAGDPAERETPAVRTVQAAGWVEPAPFAIGVAGLADGVVRAVYVLDGESVEQGQLLVELDPADAELALDGARAARDRAAASRASATARLAAAQTDWDEPVERERSVSVAESRLAEAQATRDRLPAERREAAAVARRWKIEVARLEQALSRDAATANELNIAEANLEAAESRVESFTDEATAREARVEQAEAELAASRRAAELRVAERETLDTARAARSLADAELQAAEAALREAQLRLERMTIEAPVAGNVLRRLVAPGDKVMMAMDSPTSAQVVQLYDPAALQVRVDVPLADASQVYLGQPAEVLVDVLPDRTFSGEVTHVTHLADLQKNTLEVKVRVVEPSVLLKPDMLARVRFLGSSDTLGAGGNEAARAEAVPIVRVPASGVVRDAVWVVRERKGLRGLVRSVPVETIVSTDDADSKQNRPDETVTVRGALNVGDLIVVEPTGLKTNQPVRIAEPRASSAHAGTMSRGGQ